MQCVRWTHYMHSLKSWHLLSMELHHYHPNAQIHPSATTSQSTYLCPSWALSDGWFEELVKFLCAAAGLLSLRAYYQGRTQGRAGERGHFKGLSPVSNSGQRDYTILSSLFNIGPKRELFVSLVLHCFSLCHSMTSRWRGKYGSHFR